MSAAAPAPTAVRVTTVIAVVVVAVVAAVVSYSHMTELAHRAGEEWRSWLIPISVDGLIVAASMVLLTRHRAGQAGGYLAWGSLGVGVVASLAANMADARPEVTSVLVAGWAPVAFAATFHLLLQQRRAERAAPQISDPGLSEPCSGGFGRPESGTHNAPLSHSGASAGRVSTVLPGRDGPDRSESPSRTGSTAPPAARALTGSGSGWPPAGQVVVTAPLAAPVGPVVPVGPTGDGPFRSDKTAGDSTGDTNRSTPARARTTVQKAAPVGRKRTAPAERSDAQLAKAVRELAVRSGGTPSTYAVKQALGVGSARAARLLTQLDPVPAGPVRSNGQAQLKESK